MMRPELWHCSILSAYTRSTTHDVPNLATQVRRYEGRLAGVCLAMFGQRYTIFPQKSPWKNSWNYGVSGEVEDAILVIQRACRALLDRVEGGIEYQWLVGEDVEPHITWH